MVAVPIELPVTSPVLLPTVATPTVPLVHVPPVVALLSVVIEPTHTVAVPVMAAGAPIIQTLYVAKQPLLIV